MDIQTAVIGGFTFIVCAGILFFIAKFSMKEKSYEEALAEQRKHTTALLGVSKSLKTKEKKTKKSTKKVKEKQSTAAITLGTEATEESEDTDSPVSSAVNVHPKLHVEFKEPTIIEDVSEDQAAVLHKQKPGKKKVRPILIHKQVENPVLTNIVEVPPANHFEQLHPKDEFELLHSHTVKEETAKVDLHKEKVIVNKQAESEADTKERTNKTRNQSSEVKDNKNKQVGSSKEKSKPNPVIEETQKSKKQPKVEAMPLPNVVTKTVSIEENVPDAPVVPQSNGYVPKEKKKKKNDAVNLHLLTGSKDAEVNLTLLLNAVRKAELSRSEVQILIDLLLNKQHEAPETLDEWSEGKADPVQKLKKQLAEKEKALVEEQEALIGAQAKLREIRSEQAAERVQLQQRNRNLEEALQGKHLEIQAVNGRLLSQNQKLQQMQVQINEESILIRNLREENTGLQLQCQQVDVHLSQVHDAEATIQELQGRNNQLTIELHALSDQNMAAKDHQQNVIVQLQHQVNHFKGELDEKESINRQLDDMRRDLEHRLTMGLRMENELKHELSQLKSVCQQHAEEVRRLEHGKGQAQEDGRALQKQKEDLDHLVAKLKLELRDIQGENSELLKLKASGFDQENQSHKAELQKLQNELSSVKTDVEKQLAVLKNDHAGVVAEYKDKLTKLQTDLDEQKDKNNEITSRIRTEEQQTNVKFIQRLFPKLEGLNNVGYDKWVENAEKYIESYLKGVEKVAESESEIVKLQSQLQHYKAIVDDTESILKKLQNHIEQEEILWRNEMKNKDLEIEAIKKQYSSELTTKVQHLELQLTVERDAKQKLSEQYEQMKNSQSSAISANSAIIEKLSEEVKQLNSQLSVEKNKSVGVNDNSNKIENGSSSNGPLLQEETK